MKEGTNIYYLLSVKLVDKVPMLMRDRARAADWLTQWTPKNNFKAVITNDVAQAVNVFRASFAKTCAVHNFPAGNFEFTIGRTEVEIENDVVCFDWNAEAAARVVASNINAGGLE